MSASLPPPAPGQHGIYRRLALASAAKALAVATQMGQQFVMVPLFLHFWGAERYGDWLAIFAAAGFLTLAELGLRTYYGNALLIAWSQGEPGAFARTLHQALGSFAAIVGAALAVTAAAAYFIPWGETLNLSQTGAGAATAALIMLGIHTLAAIPFGLIVSIYRARGNQDLGIVASTATAGVLLATAATVLYLGGGIVALAAAYAAALAAAWCAIRRHQRRLYPDLRLTVTWPKRDEIKAALATGPFYGVAAGALAITAHGTVLLLAGLGAAGAVVAFTAIRTLTGMARVASANLGHVVGTEMSRQYAQGDFIALGRLYGFLGRLCGGTSGGLAGLIAVIGPPFLALWTLGKVELDAVVFWAFLAVHVTTAPAEAAEKLLLYINRPRVMAVAQLGRGVATAALCLALIPHMGAAGAALAVLMADIFTIGVIVPMHAAKAARYSALRHAAQTYLSAAAALVSSYAVAMGASALIGDRTLWQLAAVALIWAVFMAGPAFFVLFTPAQRAGIVSRLRHRLPRRGLA